MFFYYNRSELWQEQSVKDESRLIYLITQNFHIGERFCIFSIIAASISASRLVSEKSFESASVSEVDSFLP